MRTNRIMGHHSRSFRPALACLAVVLLGGALPASGQTPQEDIEFASGLVGLGFPDFAEHVLAQVLMRHPELEGETQIAKAEVALHRGRLDEAEAILRKLPAGDPKAQAIEILLANVYYNRGRGDDARKIYDGFFARYKDNLPTDPTLIRFFRDAAYNYSMMLQDMGDLRGAADTRLKILETNPENDVRRRMQSESSKLLLLAAERMSGRDRDRALNDAKAQADDLLWGGMDLYFGQAISTSAHVEMLRGNPRGAQEVLDNYMEMLRTIDQALRDEGHPLSMSPLAGARFMLGRIYENDANAAASGGNENEAIQALAKALTEYYNVFAMYGDSEFGAEAGVKAREIIDRLDQQYGRKVDIDVPRTAQIGQQVFRMGDTQFRNRNYPLAIQEYEKALTSYPEVSTSGAALANLLQCFAHQDDWLLVQALTHYLGERFADNEHAPLGILATGKIFFDKKDVEKYTYLYDRYLDYFPQHNRAPLILYTLASLAKQADDMDRAGVYFKRLIDEHPQDRHALMAQSQVAWAYYAAKDYAAAIPGFQAYLDTVQPGYDRARAQFSLADCYMKTEQYGLAIRAFTELINWLKPADSPYNTSVEARTNNRGLYERAVFFRAMACAIIKEPAASVPRLRAAGVNFFKEFIAEFPQSDLAPRAMARMGGIQLELNQFDAAVQTFNDLAGKYPDSPEGENARFSLVRAAMEVGKQDIARNALNDMLANKSAYTAGDYARIGQMMLDEGMYAEAIQSYAQVVGATEERALLERALYGVGKAAYEMKDFEQAAKSFEQLMNRYPQSRYFFDAKYTLAQAYTATGQDEQAMEALRDIFQRSDDAMLVNQANLMLGKLQIKNEDMGGALASFERISLLADPEDPQLQPIIEEALLLAISTGMRSDNFTTVEDNTLQYERTFPGGQHLETVRRARQEARRRAAQTRVAEPGS